MHTIHLKISIYTIYGVYNIWKFTEETETKGTRIIASVLSLWQRNNPGEAVTRDDAICMYNPKNDICMQECITIKEYYKLKLLSIKTVIRQSFNVLWERTFHILYGYITFLWYDVCVEWTPKITILIHSVPYILNKCLVHCVDGIYKTKTHNWYIFWIGASIITGYVLMFLYSLVPCQLT